MTHIHLLAGIEFRNDDTSGIYSKREKVRLAEMERPKQRHVLNNILEAIGNTPLIRLNKLPKEMGVECEVLVKCEFFNPTGSHKDRLALNLIETAEREGHLKPGGTIIEATSGNTGLGLCLVAAIKGYRAIMVAQPKTSQEKIDLIKSLGADIVMGRSSASNDPEGVLKTAERLTKSIPGSYYTQQFSNPANPETHLKTTGIELYDQCGGKIDYFFTAAGTGGTITGTGRALKKLNPEIKVIGCDPIGSIIGFSGSVYLPFKVEGVGRDVVPPNCDLKIMDEWVKFGDKEAFGTARKVMKEEGIMCGGSAGGILWSALDYARRNKLGKDKTVVAFLPDTGRNYLTRFINNEWLLEYGFVDEEEYRRVSMEASLLPEKRYGDDLKIKDLKCSVISVVPQDATIGSIWTTLQKDEVALMKAAGTTGEDVYKGIITSRDALAAISGGKMAFTDRVDKISRADYCVLSEDLMLSTVTKMLDSREYVLFKRSATKEINIVKGSDIMAMLRP